MRYQKLGGICCVLGTIFSVYSVLINVVLSISSIFVLLNKNAHSQLSLSESTRLFYNYSNLRVLIFDYISVSTILDSTKETQTVSRPNIIRPKSKKPLHKYVLWFKCYVTLKLYHNLSKYSLIVMLQLQLNYTSVI